MIEFKNARNPVLPLSFHIPDAEAHVMPDGRLYIYGSYDDRDDVYCSDRYHVVSTGDMENWTIHEAALRGQEIEWFENPDAPKYPGIDWSHPTPFIRKMLAGMDGSDIKEKFEAKPNGKKPPLLFAPDAVFHNGQYYLYFCMSDDSEGVAVSARPDGPFSNPVQLPCGGIDPAVFKDDDGQVYYYWGQLFSHGVRLNPDLLSFRPEDVVHNLVTEEEHFFHEGSSMRKIGDTYYYVYADMERGKPTALGYATGKSPLGPFSYRGIIIDNDGCDPQSWNNHGSIQQFQGQWYVFYHRCSRGKQQYRRLCIEPITILPDGTIPEVKMTSQGAGRPFESGEEIMGYQACELHGQIYIDVDERCGEKLKNIHRGDRAIFRYVQKATPWEKIELTCAGSGKLRVLMNGRDAGEVRIENGTQYGERLSALAGQAEIELVILESDGLEIEKLILS